MELGLYHKAYPYKRMYTKRDSDGTEWLPIAYRGGLHTQSVTESDSELFCDRGSLPNNAKFVHSQ